MVNNTEIRKRHDKSLVCFLQQINCKEEKRREQKPIGYKRRGAPECLSWLSV